MKAMATTTSLVEAAARVDAPAGLSLSMFDPKVKNVRKLRLPAAGNHPG
jgi:hypothetical protein